MSGTVVIHGPMWQPECELCHDLMDVYDTLAEAKGIADDHTCEQTIRSRLRLLSSDWKIEQASNGQILLTPKHRP